MNLSDKDARSFNCPIPASELADRITLASGEGGRLTRQLIRDRVLSRFPNEQLHQMGDSALLTTVTSQIALSIDAYTVTPLFFPGGDIGTLAVYGTVNDLAVSGARPKWIGLSLVIEEGLEWSILDRVLESIQQAASLANVEVVTGDTKVVPRGAVDQLFVTTSGVGEVIGQIPSGPKSIRPGDLLIVSGPIGCHGTAILCAREKFGFEPPPVSDCASVLPPISALQLAGLFPRAIRDATRGGIAAVLHEWADACQLTTVLNESAIPVTSQVRSICELLGLEPAHLANEGTFVLAASPELVDPILSVLRQYSVSSQATVVGHVEHRRVAPVTMRRGLGREVPLDEPSGTPLPRIC